MEESRSNSGQNMGIAALITAIITFVIAVIPCVGLIAIIPGIIAIVLASVGLSQAQKSDSPRGVLLAGLIIAVVASMISLSQYMVAGKFSDRIKSGKWTEKVEDIVDEVEMNVIRELDDANVSIKVHDGDEEVEINISSGKSDKQKTLEELENDNATGDDSTSTGNQAS